MPNINAPKGFVPFQNLIGSGWNGQYNLFLFTSGDAVATFVGDMVKWGGSAGTAGQVVAGMNCEGMPTAVTFAASSTIAVGTSIAGVVRGFLVDPTQLTLKFRLASTNRVGLVITDPSVLYECQEDATAPFAAADIGLLCSFNTGAGSTVTGISASTLNNASKATTSTLPLMIRGLVPRADNAFNTGGAGTDPAKFLVSINASGQSLGGVGVAGTA